MAPAKIRSQLFSSSELTWPDTLLAFKSPVSDSTQLEMHSIMSCISFPCEAAQVLKIVMVAPPVGVVLLLLADEGQKKCANCELSIAGFGQ
jgi:hypothetical protein